MTTQISRYVACTKGCFSPNTFQNRDLTILYDTRRLVGKIIAHETFVRDRFRRVTSSKADLKPLRFISPTSGAAVSLTIFWGGARSDDAAWREIDPATMPRLDRDGHAGAHVNGGR